MNEHDATEIAFKNGYKKAAKEIFEDIEKLKHTKWDWSDVVEWNGIAKLKKKYMGETS